MAAIEERISKDGKTKSYRVQVRIKGSKPQYATFMGRGRLVGRQRSSRSILKSITASL